MEVCPMDKPLKDRYRFVYRRSPLVVKLIVLTTVALCTAALITTGILISNRRAAIAQQQARARELEQENKVYEENINDLGTPKSTQRIAYEELDLVDPDTTIWRKQLLYGVNRWSRIRGQGKINHKLWRIYFSSGEQDRSCTYLRGGKHLCQRHPSAFDRKPGSKGYGHQQRKR